MYDVAARRRGSESSVEMDEAAAWAGSAAQLHYVSGVKVSFLPSQRDPGRCPSAIWRLQIQIRHVETTGEIIT